MAVDTDRSNETVNGCGEQTTLEHDDSLVVGVGGIVFKNLDVIVDVLGYNFQVGQRTGEICGDIDGLMELKIWLEKFLFGAWTGDSCERLPHRPQQ